MLILLDYCEIAIRIPLIIFTIYTVKRLMKDQELNPIVVANFILVISDLIYLIASTIHDNAARIWEMETFGSLGVWIYLYISSFRYWWQIYTFYLISILHLIAIYAPGHFRSFDRKRTFLLMTIPTVLTIVTVTLYSILCDCVYFQIPGYYIGIRPEKQSIQDIVGIIDAWLKITMGFFLIITDIAIITKLYKMKILGKRKKISKPAQKTSQNATLPSTIALAEQSTNKQNMEKQSATKLKITIDKRLGIAFAWITFAFIQITLYFQFFNVLPVEIVPFANVLVYSLEYTKCTIYVFIVTKK